MPDLTPTSAQDDLRATLADGGLAAEVKRLRAENERLRELATLLRDQGKATSWGAAVGARQERINALSYLLEDPTHD